MTCICDTCGKETPVVTGGSAPETGWELPVDQFGYYGGFSDNMDVLLGQEENAWLKMCHDCVLKFLDTFPLLAEKITCLGHSMKHDNWDDKLATKSCCKYAWTFTRTDEGDMIYYGDGQGGWELNRIVKS